MRAIVFDLSLWKHALARGRGGRFGPAMLIGYSRDLPGGWSERVIRHEDQAFRVPDGIPDRVAVPTDPLSIAVQAILKRVPARGGRPRTFEVTRALLGRPRVPVERLVTHEFAFDRFPEAVEANRRRERSGACKTVFVPTLSP